MVGTRNHPRDFPAPTESPTKRTTRASSATTSSSSTTAKDTAPALPKPSTNTTASPTKPPARRTNSSWQHAPPLLALPWLAISLPLVIWDTGYIMLRPHTLPGGSLHWPLYAPYELYGRVDPVYSPGAYHASLGWTGAQGLGNAFETLAYAAYMWIVLAKGRREEGEGVWWLGGSWVVEGWWGPVGALVGYTTFAVTIMKSVLYWYNDAFMGFPIFKQNGWFNLIFVFAIPNAAWIVVPLYLIYFYVFEILEGLNVAAGGEKKAR